VRGRTGQRRLLFVMGLPAVIHPGPRGSLPGAITAIYALTRAVPIGVRPCPRQKRAFSA
jgi:hypothetical protein